MEEEEEKEKGKITRVIFCSLLCYPFFDFFLDLNLRYTPT